jgi:hypothetical protein
VTTEPAIVAAVVKTIREGLAAYENKVLTPAMAREASNSIAHSLLWEFEVEARNDVTEPLR